MPREIGIDDNDEGFLDEDPEKRLKAAMTCFYCGFEASDLGQLKDHVYEVHGDYVELPSSVTPQAIVATSLHKAVTSDQLDVMARAVFDEMSNHDYSVDDPIDTYIKIRRTIAEQLEKISVTLYE